MRNAVASPLRRPAVPLLLAALTWAAVAAPAAAWTPETQKVIAREAASMAPPDLRRQLERYPRQLAGGAVEPFHDGEAARHVANADGSGRLEEVIEEEVARAVAAIEAHQPFESVVFQLGVVSHYVADASNPLNTSHADAREASYFADYLRYAESTLPRLPLLFYGLDPALEGRRDVSPLIRRSLARGRRLYPLIGREYRRIGFASGLGRFDDRSTAFAIASLAFNHAINDVALAWRQIWLAAGGGDERRGLPRRGERLIQLPRATVEPPPPPRRPTVRTLP